MTTTATTKEELGEGPQIGELLKPCVSLRHKVDDYDNDDDFHVIRHSFKTNF